MPASTDLPPLPQSSMTNERGELRPEWRRYLTALDAIMRELMES